MIRLKYFIMSGCVLTLTACSHVPALNDTLPYPFQALGNEPGWSIVIQKNLQAEVILNTGDTRFFTEFKKETTADNSIRFTSTNPALQLTIRKGDCNDTMSDTHYHYQAQLEADNTRFQGCGRAR